MTLARQRSNRLARLVDLRNANAKEVMDENRRRIVEAFGRLARIPLGRRVRVDLYSQVCPTFALTFRHMYSCSLLGCDGALQAAVKECGKLETLNIERSTGFRPRKDVALKTIVLGVDGNTQSSTPPCRPPCIPSRSSRALLDHVEVVL